MNLDTPGFLVVMSVAERLHMLSELEEKYAIELDKEFHGYGNEVEDERIKKILLMIYDD